MSKPMVYYTVTVREHFTGASSEVAFKNYQPAVGYGKVMQKYGRSVTLKVVCDDGLERKIDLNFPSINHPWFSSAHQ